MDRLSTKAQDLVAPSQTTFIKGRYIVDGVVMLHEVVHELYSKKMQGDCLYQLVNQCWTRGLWRMSTVEEMAQFVLLWDLVQGVLLSDEEDRIIWKFTADGQYTAKSAYEVQFRGSFCSFRPRCIWPAYAEPKHRFFTWLLVQERILTADKLQDRNWPCNPLCALCKLAPETAQHICL